MQGQIINNNNKFSKKKYKNRKKERVERKKGGSIVGYNRSEFLLSLIPLMFEDFSTEKNLSNEIEGTSEFVYYRRISLQPI